MQVSEMCTSHELTRKYQEVFKTPFRQMLVKQTGVKQLSNRSIVCYFDSQYFEHYFPSTCTTIWLSSDGRFFHHTLNIHRISYNYSYPVNVIVISKNVLQNDNLQHENESSRNRPLVAFFSESLTSGKQSSFQNIFFFVELID